MGGAIAPLPIIDQTAERRAWRVVCWRSVCRWAT